MALLLEFGCTPNERDAQQVTTLHIACTVDSPPIVDMLIDKGASVNRIDKLGRTPLHFAVFHNQIRVVSKLLERLADVDSKDNYGQVRRVRVSYRQDRGCPFSWFCFGCMGAAG